MEDLMNAARVGDVNALYASMRLNSKILDEIDEFPLINTPLHVAASEGHTDFAVEILTLKPSFGRKLNPDGFSPLHLAVQCARSETAEQLLKIDSELVRVKGRERLTPLHWAAAVVDVKKGAAVDLLAEFLCACPASIEDVTVRGETALHVAMKSSNVRGFQILLGWIWRTYNRHVLGWKDREGNTVLHLAVSANQPEIVRMLTKKAPIIINEMNTAKMTALDIASSYQNVEEGSSNRMTAIREILNRARASSSSSLSLVKQLDDSNNSNLADFLISPERPSEALIQFLTHCRRGLSMDMRSVILVVAILIATATFQAVLSPPGGVSMDNINNNNNNNNNNTIDKVKFYSFYGFNSLTFSASVTVIILITPWRPFIPILGLQMSLLFLTVSYWASISIFSPPPWLNAILLFLSVPLPFVGLVYKITFWLVEKIMRMDLYYRWSWTQQVVNFFTLLIGRAGRLRLLQMGRVGRFRMLYRVLQHHLDTRR